MVLIQEIDASAASLAAASSTSSRWSDRDSIRGSAISRKAPTGIAPRSRPLRRRTATASSAASRFPITSMYGIFCSCASRILACMRSRRSLTSMRSPASVRRLATSCA